MSFYALNTEMDEMHHRLRKWLEQLSQHRLSSCWRGAWTPPADIHETTEAYHVFVDLAGIDPSTIELEIEDDTLHLNGRRQRPQVRGCTRIHQMEIDFGKFHRTFHFPVRLNADVAGSSYRNGFLEVVLPKLQRPASVRVSSQQG